MSRGSTLKVGHDMAGEMYDRVTRGVAQATLQQTGVSLVAVLGADRDCLSENETRAQFSLHDYVIHLDRSPFHFSVEKIAVRPTNMYKPYCLINKSRFELRLDMANKDSDDHRSGPFERCDDR